MSKDNIACEQTVRKQNTPPSTSILSSEGGKTFWLFLAQTDRFSSVEGKTVRKEVQKVLWWKNKYIQIAWKAKRNKCLN
jgi:hypothetical protein